MVSFQKDQAFATQSMLMLISESAWHLQVNDCLLDPRFKNFPFVAGPPFVRFYAGKFYG